MTDSTRVASSGRDLALEPGAEVDLLLTSTDLRIRGVDGDHLTVRSTGGEDLDDEVSIDAAPGHVSIREAERGFRLGPMRVRTHLPSSLAIDVPRTAKLSIRTLSGDIDADDVGGESRWATTSGTIRVRLSGGAVSIESMSGDVSLESSGPVAVRARSVSGDLHVEAPRFDAVRASTASGDIRIRGALGADATNEVSSVSGDVLVETASPVRLETQTIAGDVRASADHRAEGGRGRRTIVVGDGSVRMTARTTSGDIQLRPSAPAGSVGARSGESAPRSAAPAPTAPAAPVVPAAPAVPPAPAAPAIEPWVVAEAEAAPNLVRDPFRQDGVDRPTTGSEPVTDRREAARLDILRALERGELDVEAASRRLEHLEEAGPRFFRGWC